MCNNFAHCKCKLKLIINFNYKTFICKMFNNCKMSTKHTYHNIEHVNYEELSIEIANQIPSFSRISVHNDDVDIYFSNTLNEAEISILNSIIAQCQCHKSIRDQFFVINPKMNKIKWEGDVLCSSFDYKGSSSVGTITHIEIIAKKNEFVTSYTCYVLNSVSALKIAEKKNITNNKLSTIDLGHVSNIPKDQCIMEIHIIKNGGTKDQVVELEQITIYLKK